RSRNRAAPGVARPAPGRTDGAEDACQLRHRRARAANEEGRRGRSVQAGTDRRGAAQHRPRPRDRGGGPGIRARDRRALRDPGGAAGAGSALPSAPLRGGAAGRVATFRDRRYHRRGVMLRRGRVWGSIAAATVAAALAVAWPLVGFASSGHTASILASSTLVDATGDAFNGGPDIGTVTVNDDEAGKISVT